MQDSTGRRDAKVFVARATLQGMCDHLSDALKPLANQQKDGDSSVNMVVQRLPERSWLNMMDWLRSFIMVASHEEVKVDDLEKNMESRPVEKPKFTIDFPEAVVWGGVDELTLRADEAGALRTFVDTTKVGAGLPEAVVREGAEELTLRAEEECMLRTFTDTRKVGDNRCGPPLVDEDWHAPCQAIFQGVEGSEWETRYYKCVELHQGVKSKQSGDNKKARALWSLKEAKDKGIDFYDLGSVQKIPTAALAKRTGTYRAKKMGWPSHRQ